MKVGLLFGTFNPVHIGHMIIAGYMAEFTDLEEVWMIVSPQNPLKEENSLLEENLRMQMVSLAIGDQKKIKASDIEFNLPKPSYTINTLNHLSSKYIEHDFVLIIGTDNLQIFEKWKDHDQILKNYEVYVYPRLPDTINELNNHSKVKFIDAPIMEISATFIRKAIREKKDVHYMLPGNIYNFIKEKHLYE